jgi:hypothetical protein
MVEIETFNLYEDLLVDYDYNSLDDLKLGSFKDIKLVVGLVLTFNAPFGSENIATHRDMKLTDIQQDIQIRGPYA